MPLPELIEIVPLARPVEAEITVPGSKSITNRALVLAALAEGTTTLRGALWSEDTQVMVACLNALGFNTRVEPDPDELCNRIIEVQGQGGRIPKGGTREKPLSLFVGNAGTAARFLAALVCLGQGVYQLQGVPRMHERPQAALFEALRQLGYDVASPNDRLPAIISGACPRPGLCWVSIAESSQFASALLLPSQTGGWEVEIAGENEEESPYVIMTSKVVASFPARGGTFQIEPDASSGSYFWAAGVSEFKLHCNELSAETGQAKAQWTSHPLVRVAHWPTSGWQIDSQFPAQFRKVTLGSAYFELDSLSPAGLRGHLWQDHVREGLARAGQHPDEPGQVSSSPFQGETLSRRTDLGDSIMTAIVMAPLGISPMRFTHLGRLRLQECERVMAMRTELTRCGAAVVEEGDTLQVRPSLLHGAEIETYGDHRMAMCFAILGLKVPGIKIKNPACVKKTFPNFFQKLAAPPPGGLGVTIRDGHTGRVLDGDDLFAS